MEFDYEGMVTQLLHDESLIHDLFGFGVTGDLVLFHDLHSVDKARVFLADYRELRIGK